MSDWEYPLYQSSSPRLRAPKDGIVSSAHRPTSWLAQSWGNIFRGLEATHGYRLARGRTFARSGRVRSLWFSPGLANAEVVHRDAHHVSLRVRVFDDDEWQIVIDVLLSRLQFIGSLLEGELPSELGRQLKERGLNLIPHIKEIDGDCNCQDYLLPCSHMAAVHTVLAQALEGEPFLLLTLRGRPREQLLADLRMAWGDNQPMQKIAPEETEPPLDPNSWYSSPTPLPNSMHFDFQKESDTVAVGLKALGPAPAKGDLNRALSPLYEAGAEAAEAIAHEDFRRQHEREGRRSSRKRKSKAPINLTGMAQRPATEPIPGPQEAPVVPPTVEPEAEPEECLEESLEERLVDA
ncbi:MAG: hypothetical protein HN348_20935, partial [Proteobacteria bacterium]|nr:hypothetical protein [Pseudomonadota bacterium]